MAKAPDGKWYTFPHRQRLDHHAKTKAVLDVRNLPSYREAGWEEQRETCLRAERDEEERRKRTGRHASCLFDRNGVPLTMPVPAVKTAKGGLRYKYAQTDYGIEEDDFAGLEKLEEEDDEDDDGDENEIVDVSSDEEDEEEEDEDETSSENEEANDSDDSDQDTGPALSTGRSHPYPDNKVYHIYLPDSRRLDRLNVPAAPGPNARASLQASPLAAMTTSVDMSVGRALGYSEMNAVYHVYLPAGKTFARLDQLGLGSAVV